LWRVETGTGEEGVVDVWALVGSPDPSMHGNQRRTRFTGLMNAVLLSNSCHLKRGAEFPYKELVELKM
jgi:hypothetical protein